MQASLTVPSRSWSHWLGPLTDQVFMPHWHTGNSLRVLETTEGRGFHWIHLLLPLLLLFYWGAVLHLAKIPPTPQCEWNTLVLEKESYPRLPPFNPSLSALTPQLALSPPVSASGTFLVPSGKSPLTSKLRSHPYSYQVLATLHNQLHHLGLPSRPS